MCGAAFYALKSKVNQGNLNDSTVHLEGTVSPSAVKERDMEETITITKKEYDQLLKDSRFLNALEEYGVDNWDGYGDAFRSLKEK